MHFKRNRVLGVCLAVLAFSLGPHTALAALSCTAQAGARNLRAEGAAELVGDIVLTCTGGEPTPQGWDLPRHQVLVAFNTGVTSRELVESSDFHIGWSEALLIVDEPAAAEQRPCSPPLPEPTLADTDPPDEETCFAVKGDAGAPNVFQGRPLQPNVVLFPDVPIDPPGPGGLRKLRLTNLRVNASAEIEDLDTEKQTTPATVIASVEIFEPDGRPASIEHAELEVGTILPAVSFELRTRDDAPVSAAEPALQMTPSAMTRRPNGDDVFLIRFSEAFPEGFRRRNVGTNTADPLFVIDQADPSTSYRTETGFFNVNFPRRRGLNRAGLADSGTRFLVTLAGIPNGVRLWVSPRDVETGATEDLETAPQALLTHAGALGGGPFVARPAFEGDMVEIVQFEGSATVVWEVVSTDPDTIEDITLALALSSDGNAVLGEASLTASIAPIADLTKGVSTPSFVEEDPAPDPLPAFAVVAALPKNRLVSVSAASYQGSAVAPGSIVAAFGTGLAALTVVAEIPLKETLGGTRLEVIDSRGVARAAKLFAVSAGQVNFLLAPETALGPAIVNVYRDGKLKATGALQVESLAPALFSANGDGLGVAAGQSARAVGSTVQLESLATLAGDHFEAAAIDLGQEGEQVYLILYGTGISGATVLENVVLAIGGVAVPVSYAGPQNQFPGLDQINAGPLPRPLEGRGVVDAVLTVHGKTSNRVQLRFR